MNKEELKQMLTDMFKDGTISIHIETGHTFRGGNFIKHSVIIDGETVMEHDNYVLFEYQLKD